MDFTLTPDQREFRDVLRKFLAAKSPEEEVRRLMESESGYDARMWREFGEQLGAQGVAIPEDFGGSGMGHTEVGIVTEELGSSLACVPYFSTVVLAANALILSQNAALNSMWLSRIAAAECIATLAVVEGSGRWNLAAVTTEAREEGGGGWLLSGEKTFVSDGHSSDLILVVARVDQGLGIFAVEAGARGLTVTPESTMDQTRKFATVELANTPAHLVTRDAESVLERVRDLALAALAAEQVGGAQRCLDMAVEHAKTRLQFGRPIGSFQAIKHKCAEILIAIEAARAATAYALWACDHAKEESALASSMAKALASQAYFRAAADNIQIHGGIGFTWEHPAHLYFKRAKSSELWWGDVTAQHRRVGELLQLGSAG